jgi:hypothetical protein
MAIHSGHDVASDRSARQRPRWPDIVLILVVATGLIFVASVAWAITCNPIGLGGDCMPWVPHEPLATLSLSAGSPESDSNDPHGLGRFNAHELNRVHFEEGSAPRIRFVDADVASTGPTVVSVNPLDRFSWGGASYSTQTKRCYLILLTQDRTNPEFGGTTYGVLPRGRRCVGSAATPQSVAADDWPDISVSHPAWIAEGVVLAGLGTASLAFCITITWRRSIQRRQIEWVSLTAGIVLVTMGLVPLLEGLG